MNGTREGAGGGGEVRAQGSYAQGGGAVTYDWGGGPLVSSAVLCDTRPGLESASAVSAAKSAVFLTHRRSLILVRGIRIRSW